MEDIDRKSIITGYCELDWPVFPVGLEKVPLVNWTHFRQRMEPNERLLYFNERWNENIAYAAGEGVHLIDVDTKYDLTSTLMLDLIAAISVQQMGLDILAKLSVAQTKSGGTHFWFKNPMVKASTKLAMRYTTEQEREIKPDETVKVLIETRGEGGYALIWPSHGYKWIQGDISTMPDLTDDEMLYLFSVCERFNEVVVETDTYKRQDWNDVDTNDTPQNVYNLSGQLEDLLISHGWSHYKEYGDRIYYTRPGKDKGVSADYHKKLNCITFWTTSTEFKAQEAMSPFYVYAQLEHNGDMSAAARALAKLGFGKMPMRKHRDIQQDFDSAFYFGPDEGDNEMEDAKLLKVMGSRWSIKNEKHKKEWCLFIRNGKQRYRVAGPGSILLLTGPPKSTKTTALSAIIASALTTREFLNMTFYARGKKVLVFDTEQDESEIDTLNRKMYAMMETSEDYPNFHHFPLSDLTFKERADIIMKIVSQFELETPGDIALIVIDGCRDLIKDINDWGEAAFLTDYLKALRDRTRACVATVMHQTKQFKFVRGAAGSELENKISGLLELSKEENDGLTQFGIEVKYVRGASGVPKYYFHFNDNGMPVITGEESYADKTSESIELIDSMNITELVRHMNTNDKDMVF